jgi:tripartite-type tricarboxylate transporter receptor subunit TctC
MHSTLRSVILGLAVLTFGAAETAVAQKWPERPVRFVTSQAAGNATDVIARFTGERIGPRIGQPIVVENRPGGGNVIGAQHAARSAPDGYTFFLATAAVFVTDPHTYKSLPYDPNKDFVPVSRISEVSFVILANPNLPVKNFAELMAKGKAEPDKITIATDGLRRFSGMTVTWLNKLSGMQLRQVPYTGQVQSAADAIGGQVDLVILSVPAARAHVASGKLRPLAVTAQKRVPEFPDVPAIAETFPGFDFTGWHILVAPTGTPQDILVRMNREMDTVLKEPEVQARLRKMAFTIYGGSLDDVRRFVDEQRAAWAKVVKEIGVKPQ